VLSVRESGNRDDLGDGHDPRLRTGKAEASTCFFLDLFSQSPSHRPSEKAKYALAKRVVDYVSTLAGRPIELDELYATNICNQFLSATPKGAVVLIPDAVADEGVRKNCANPRGTSEEPASDHLDVAAVPLPSVPNGISGIDASPD